MGLYVGYAIGLLKQICIYVFAKIFKNIYTHCVSFLFLWINELLGIYAQPNANLQYSITTRIMGCCHWFLPLQRRVGIFKYKLLIDLNT